MKHASAHSCFRDFTKSFTRMGSVTERSQGLHDAIDPQIAREPDGSRCMSRNNRIVLGQVMTVLVLVWVVDQPDVLSCKADVQPPVLGRRDHPAPIGGEYRIGLIRDPPDGLGGVVLPHQGVIVDENVG